MSHSNWKAVERQHSAMLGCSGRVGPTGLDLPDSFSKVLALESKDKAKVPEWITEAVQQSVDNRDRLAEMQRAEGEDPGQRLPIVVVHADRTNYKDDVVMMRLSEFIERVLPLLQR